MVVTESQVNNIMGGMENTAGVRLHSHRHKLKQRFDILRKLGQGTYGKVQLAVNKETSQEVAIKTIKKAKIETEQDLIRIRREIQIMSSVQHPQIIHIYEVFENREKMVLVMEYAAGGELYDYLSDRKVLNEEEARRVFRQVASAVYYCHKHKICHRDLKLENILLDLEGNAKIADFGLSNVFGDKRRLDTFCGSPLYASPEIVKGIPYAGPEVDCWSLGVLLYTLVYGAMPFDGSNFKRLVKQITMGDYYEPKKPSRASDLIRHMLTVSAAKRASIEDICSHWWVNEGYMESCLEVAEFLANQTPVRLDLLLSLVPKHINSEHMLIQPDEEDSSHEPQVNADSQGAPQLELPPPPPLPSDNELVPDVPARSHSMGAMANIDQSEFEALLELKRQEKREKEEDEKKRKREGSSTAERKKKKDATSEGTPRSRRKESSTTKTDDSSQAATMDTDVSECSEATPSVRRKGSKKPPTGPAGSDSLDRKKSTRRKDSMNEGRDHSEKSERRKSIKKREPSMEVDVNDVSERSERRKSLKKKELSVDRDVSESEKSERRKSIKKRDTSTGRESSANAEKTEKKRNLKQKEKDIEKSDSITQNDTSIEPSSVISVDKPVNKPDSLVNDKEISENSHEAQVTPTPTTEVVRKPPLPREVQEKIRLSSEDSRPPPKDEVARLGKSSEQEVVMKSKGDTDGKKIIDKSSSGKSLISLTSNEGTLKASDSSISRAGSISPVKTAGDDSGISSLSSHVKKEKSKSKSPVPKISIEIPKVSGIQDTSSPETTGILGSPQSPLLPPDTEKILQETASKIKETEGYSTPVKAKSPEVKSGDVKSESTSSKDSSRQSSLTSTPVRSRTGSESSTDAPGRRQSKIFSKAAMWDNMITQGTKEKTPTGDKPKKIGRPGGPNMADLTKKFEDKSAPERKSVVLPAFKEEQEIQLLKDSLVKTLPDGGKAPSVTSSRAGSKEKLYSPRADRRTPGKEVQIIPPSQVLSPTPRDKEDTSQRQWGSARKETPSSGMQQSTPTVTSKATPIASVSSDHHVHKTRKDHPPRSSKPLGEPQLQRARRERIIPIMLEDDDDDDRSLSESQPPPNTPSSARQMVSPDRGGMGSSSSSLGGGGVRGLSSPLSSMSSTSHTKASIPSEPSSQHTSRTVSPEPIKKSRRERIIPISVEGEGIVTPPSSVAAGLGEVGADLGAARAHEAFQRNLGTSGRNKTFRTRGFSMLDRSESFSSAGEDEEDEDDGFQILTAESLFSTLLNRVRNLTRKMNADERPERKRSSHQATPEPAMSPPPHSAGAASGFWSSLYSSPRDSPARRISETLSRSFSREEDGGVGGMTSPAWSHRSVSRDPSDADTVFSESSTPFSTLPRARAFRHSLHTTTRFPHSPLFLSDF